MAKRFTDTALSDKAWYQELSPRLSCLWDNLCRKCDIAGIWDTNWKMMSMTVGEDVCADDMEAFGDRVELLPNGKWWLTGFIGFQYGTLSEKSKPHIAVVKILDKYGLKTRVSNGHTRGIEPLKNKDKDKNKEQDKDKDKKKTPYTDEFEVFWKIHPQGGKKVAFKAYQEHAKNEPALANIAIKNYLADRKATNTFTQDTSTFLNQHDIMDWQKEREVPEPPQKKGTKSLMDIMEDITSEDK